MTIYETLSTKATPQTAPADPRQVVNHAGGYVFKLTPEQSLRRFLILGTTAGTYYASPQKHTADAFDVKYQSRGGTSHKTVLGLVRPKPKTTGQNAAFRFATGKLDPSAPVGLRAVDGYSAAHAPGANVAKVITEFELPFEAVPSEALALPATWHALLPHMGITALIRNLGRMTANGTLADTDFRRLVLDRLADVEVLRKGRVHPMAVLIALGTYTAGHGDKGSLSWPPIPAVTDALDRAFYTCFGNVEPTGKRRLIALDVSGSMNSPVANTNISCRAASTAMAMITLATERDVDVMGFSTRFMPLAISARQRLDDAMAITNGLPFEGTDCALPMFWALETGKQYDSFEIYTDCETYAGRRGHPHQALTQYQNKTGIDAKLIVIGLSATPFTIAVPGDPSMLDVVGFDSSAPALMSNFIAGRL